MTAIPPRRRLSRDERHQQLLDTAWQLIGDEGSEALSLGRLAERSGVTKPVVYDHFGTRMGLLVALYKAFDARQNALMDAALQACPPVLEEVAGVIAASYVECVLRQGREIPGVIAALAGSPELEAVKREYELAFIEKCRLVLAPHAPGGKLPAAGLWGMLGAANGLSNAAAQGQISARQAEHELRAIIVAMVGRGRSR
ncbi:TetR/AcrR family transcriptional regulator [Bordetella petrii]|uniref:TetR/AcrR family transcriptional regulator n=1 Tax=Bordetella petrii TaxID=94624 RepID=UPI003732AF46